MNIYRVWGLIMRYIILLKNSLPRQMLILYFPVLDIVVFALTSLWINQIWVERAFDVALLYIVLRVYWSVANSLQLELTGNLIQEFESRNLVNLFSAPITLPEWVCATSLIALLRGLFSLIYGAFLAWFLFSIDIFSVGYVILPAFILIAWSGLSAALVLCSLILRYGQTMRTTRFFLMRALIIFSAVFYPLDILPGWMQQIAYVLPTTYVFQLVRQAIIFQKIMPHTIMMSIVLNALYFFAALFLFYRQFSQCKIKGLMHTEAL